MHAPLTLPVLKKGCAHRSGLSHRHMMYVTSESMVMAVHESFLWVSDLSQPDSWILPIAAGLTQYFSFTTQTATMDQSSAGMMNSMKYFFPVMIFLMGRSFPAGLSLYWFVGTLVTIAQNFMLRGYKDKLKEQAEEKRALPEFI